MFQASNLAKDPPIIVGQINSHYSKSFSVTSLEIRLFKWNSKLPIKDSQKQQLYMYLTIGTIEKLNIGLSDWDCE